MKRSFVLQSLQLSKDNEQSHIRLSSLCGGVCICPHLAASGKVGLTECRKLSKLASWRYRVSRPSSPVPRTSLTSYLLPLHRSILSGADAVERFLGDVEKRRQLRQ